MVVDIFDGATTIEKNEALGRAFTPWTNGDYPEARTIGDVVIIMAEQSTKEGEMYRDRFVGFLHRGTDPHGVKHTGPLRIERSEIIHND